MSNHSVVANHARSEEQRVVLEQIIQDGVCPFCLENLARYHAFPLTIVGTHWVVTQNQWPYKHTLIQLLVISKRHVETISELTPEEWAEWPRIIAQALEAYSISSGAVCMRFGDPRGSGASVLHLHTHIIVSDPNDPEPVRYPIGGLKT